MVKNCDRGLENTARGRRPRAAFSRQRSQFFTKRTDLSRQITCLFFSCSKLVLQPITNGHVHATLSLRLARRLLTICKKNIRKERVTQILNKERCTKDKLFLDPLYVSYIYQCHLLSSPILFFRCEILCEV